ncbi:MAG TPA: hypothetical protein PLF32_06740 [Bacteroidales bacterium]|jgi:hypothetical protein|nr:hypothetical protein [Bacteroidales bacterium]HON20055.1 hypothetical protein [Bacteroidales bacterium]HOR82335.1 hypothetical protein [Bacteroidales bacterium]HPJ91579.1 hypothetical protein [Bacteroidales bacterium]HQB19271.1 hypothetical protein [Bacteroidales bacterium]
MRTKYLHIICRSCILTILLCACKPPKTFPIIPYIEFRSFTKIDNGTGKDDKGILAIYFTDGDGNIGLKENEKDTSYNFFMNYFECQEGVWTETDFSTNFNFRLPIINTSDKEQALEGIIELEIFFNNPRSAYDTIRFECWLFDRDSNESNHIFTPPIIVNK